MGIFGIDPLWVTSVEGEFDRKEDAEAQRTAVEQWLAYAGMEPGHLNLLPKYTIWVRTMVKYGLGAIKLMPEMTIEKVAAYENARSVVFTDFVRHEGPVALPLLFEDFLIPPMTSDLERAPIVCQRAKLNKFDLENLKSDPTYNKADLEKILTSPDRGGPEKSEQDIESETGVREDQGPLSEQWDLYEAFFPYAAAGNKFHLIATYHKGTQTMPKCVFNWLPENSIPYHAARLGSDGERSYGFGFCEMLRDYQEEIAAIHNQRRDASTLSNTNLLRVSPGTQLDSQFAIYPNALLPAEEGHVEVIPLGRGAGETIQDENMVLQEATDRAGVGASSSGSGSGSVNKKGVYSAMGSFQVMQEGNTRANLNITEFRQSHYMFGRQAVLYWANFGIPDRDLKALAKQGPVLQKALENYKKGRIILPIRAASGSVNKEIEKQNMMLLLNNMRAHWQQISQMMQATANPMMPPNYKDYLLQVILSSQVLMKRIVRDFSISDPSAILPEPMGVKEELEKTEQQAEQQKRMQQVQQVMQQQGPPQPGAPGQQPQLPPGPQQVPPEAGIQ